MTVLDEMLSAKAGPDDVAKYTQALSPSDFCAEAGKSLLFSRAVSLDFCLAGGDEWWSELLARWRCLPMTATAYLGFQVAAWRSRPAKAGFLQKVADLKLREKAYRALDRADRKTFVPHPYVYSKYDLVAELDDTCLALSEKGPYAISEIGSASIRPEMFTDADSSLFRLRLMQEDVFSGLDEVGKWHFIKAVPKMRKPEVVSFFRQVMSSCETAEVKSALYDELRRYFMKRLSMTNGLLFTDVLQFFFDDKAVARDVMNRMNSVSSYCEFALPFEAAGGLPPGTAEALAFARPEWVLEAADVDFDSIPVGLVEACAKREAGL